MCSEMNWQTKKKPVRLVRVKEIPKDTFLMSAQKYCALTKLFIQGKTSNGLVTVE